jgi:membrane-associated phospholipid phosphatase
MFTILSLFFAVFTSMKSAIPKIVPFYADPYVLAADRVLHGTDPWRIIQPFTGHPFITLALDYSYGLWLGQFLLAIAFSTFMLRNDGLRRQFLVSTVLAWTILGSLLATLFSSVGPCFYKDFFGPDVYGPLLGYLKGVQSNYHLFAMDAQAMLFRSYQTSETGLATGISAFPSMHVACSALCALFFSRINRWLGFANWTLTILVMVASVQLAWHYAIDGYVSLILVLLIWKLAGRFAPGGPAISAAPSRQV